MIDGLCQRWSVTPSAVLAEPVWFLMAMGDALVDGGEEAPEPMSEDETRLGLLAMKAERGS